MHSYATETLGCDTNSTGTKTGSPDGKKDLYFNARVKYPYCLDTGLRIWNEKIGSKFLTEGSDSRFVKTDSKAMAAGPVYESLRDWKSSGKTINLTIPTIFILEGFYPFITEFFKTRPSWLMELTHMETPWKNTEIKLKHEYGGDWPSIIDKSDYDQIAKQRAIQAYYQKTLVKFIQDESESENSMSYRLFMLSMVDKIKKDQQLPSSSSNEMITDITEDDNLLSPSRTQIGLENMDID